jgi:hypothetical protein
VLAGCSGAPRSAASVDTDMPNRPSGGEVVVYANGGDYGVFTLEHAVFVERAVPAGEAEYLQETRILDSVPPTYSPMPYLLCRPVRRGLARDEAMQLATSLAQARGATVRTLDRSAPAPDVVLIPLDAQWRPAGGP